MGFEGSSNGDGWNGFAQSPGGHEFGVQGWTWGQPIPKSITFYLDGSAEVKDQYGRSIRRAVTPEGQEVRFADSPPGGARDGAVVPRPQYANHAQVLAALAAERIDWLAYEVRYRDKAGQQRMQTNLTLAAATKLQERLLQDGCNPVMCERVIACAGWPQLPYEELKKLPELPPTPVEELEKIRDPKLRADALRIKAEASAAREKELQPT